jgi:hypothetical protein
MPGGFSMDGPNLAQKGAEGPGKGRFAAKGEAMKDTFIFLERESHGVWLDPKNATLVRAGLLTSFPEGGTLIAIAPTAEGAQLAVRYYTAVNTNARAAVA